MSLRRDGGSYIPLLPFPASRILLLKNPAFALYLTSQNPPVLLPRKSVCCHTLPHRRVCRHPLFRVSRKQRYNTLDFAEQNRVPTGMLRAPIGNPVQKGIFPLQSLIFFAGACANCKSNSLKIKKRCNLRHIIGRKLQRFITLNVNKKWAAISTALI